MYFWSPACAFQLGLKYAGRLFMCIVTMGSNNSKIWFQKNSNKNTLNYLINEQEVINEQVWQNFLIFTGKNASKEGKNSKLNKWGCSFIR